MIFSCGIIALSLLQYVRSNHLVELVLNQDNSGQSYYTEIWAGGQPLMVGISLLSTNTWIMSTTCSSPRCRSAVNPRYNPSLSSSGKQPFSLSKTIVSANDAAVTGSIYSDWIVVRQGQRDKPYAETLLKNIPFLLANTVNSKLPEPVVGYIGIGLDKFFQRDSNYVMSFQEVLVQNEIVLAEDINLDFLTAKKRVSLGFDESFRAHYFESNWDKAKTLPIYDVDGSWNFQALKIILNKQSKSLEEASKSLLMESSYGLPPLHSKVLLDNDSEFNIVSTSLASQIRDAFPANWLMGTRAGADGSTRHQLSCDLINNPSQLPTITFETVAGAVTLDGFAMLVNIDGECFISFAGRDETSAGNQLISQYRLGMPFLKDHAVILSPPSATIQIINKIYSVSK